MYSLKVYWFLAKLGKNLELKTAREFDSAISLRRKNKNKCSLLPYLAYIYSDGSVEF